MTVQISGDSIGLSIIQASQRSTQTAKHCHLVLLTIQMLPLQNNDT